MRLFSGLFVLGLILVLPVAKAQTEAAVSADGISAKSAVWQVQVNVNKLFSSPVGALINEIIEKEADKEVKIDALVEAVGFDPRTSIQEIVIFGDTFEPTSASAIANLGESRGNIEGWLLAAPGYQSEEVEGTIVHSIDVDDKEVPRLWCAIPEGSKGYVLVAGFNADRVRALVDQVKKDSTDSIAEPLADSSFLTLFVNDLSKAPIEIDEDEPGSAIIKTIQSVVLNIGMEGNLFNSNCQITTDSAARAEQLNQLIVGMKAMVQLAMPQKEPETKELLKYVNNLTAEYTKGSNIVETNFAIDFEVIKELIDKEILKD